MSCQLKEKTVYCFVYDNKIRERDMDLLEAMNTARAIRHYKSDPVPKDLIHQLIFSATRASNPQNSQMWEFIIVDDKDKKNTIAKAVGAGFTELTKQSGAPAKSDIVDFEQMLSHAPAIIFIAARNEYPAWGPDEKFVGSACYPAGQNLIVAARALGIGAAFTQVHTLAEDAIRETLGIPSHVLLALTIPIGYPDRKFGPVRRKPIEEVIHWNKF